MIRIVFTPDRQKITIDLPKNFIGKKVEIIAFAIEEAVGGIDIPFNHLVTETVLSNDWLTLEEDKAWKDL